MNKKKYPLDLELLKPGQSRKGNNMRIPQQPMKKVVYSNRKFVKNPFQKQSYPIVIYYHVTHMGVGPDKKIISTITQSWN